MREQERCIFAIFTAAGSPLIPPSRKGARNAPPFSSLSKHKFTLLFVGEVSVAEVGLYEPPSGRAYETSKINRKGGFLIS